MAFVYTPAAFLTPVNTVSRGKSHSQTTNTPGAQLFPVASGVQVPYVGSDEFNCVPLVYDRPSTFLTDDYIYNEPSILAYNSVVSTAVLQNSNTFVKIRPDSPKDDSSAKLLKVLSRNPHAGTDKSSKEISKKYLQKISNGLTFSDDVVGSRAPHTIPYDGSKAREVFRAKGIEHGKTKSKGLLGRHDTRGTIKRHMPCHLKGPRKLKPLANSQRSIHQNRDLRDVSLNDVALIPKGETVDGQIPRELSRHGWDEYVLASLSKTTAERIVQEHLSGSEKERLGSFLKKRLELRQDALQLEKILPSIEAKSQTELGMMKKANDDKTGKPITELHYTPSFLLPRRVGDKKLETRNIYQQEMLGGAQPIPSKKLKDQDAIVLDSNDKIKFKKHLQENFPQGAISWYPNELKQQTSISTIRRQQRGMQRWKDLPSVVQDETYMYMPAAASNTDVELSELSTVYKQRKKIKDDVNVVKIAEEWRSKWFLERRWQNSSTDELLQGMTDINDHVRLAAVAACSKAAMIRKTKREKPKLQGIVLDKAKEPDISLQDALEPELLDMVASLLTDKNVQVRIAAAITLYTLKTPSQEAERVLLWSIGHGGAPEQWAATQCLALSGAVCDPVINELVRQLHSDSSVRAVEAGGLLAELSRHSGIVQSLIAELLNSSSWKDRATACKVIPKLRGGLNKDMTHKLSYLMWNDWSRAVRTAAAQALGKTGNGKLVHDALQERILSGNERVKVDALKKLSTLGIMTARLLPALLACFNSEYVFVRIEAVMAAGLLRITDDKMLADLLVVASNDRSWKVKAHAIKAVGCIGLVNDKVVDVLLWAIRYEKVAAVRAEGCNAVAKLRIKDERILSVLQDRLVVESDDLVKREAIFTLQCLGVEPTGDVEMTEAIRKEVRRLCTRNEVVAHILEEDNRDSYNTEYKRLLTTSTGTSPVVPDQRVPTRNTGSRGASQASQRGWDPILAGYQARETMSRGPTTGDLHMEHSYLPMDLNSASSENSSVIALDEECDGLSDDDISKLAEENTRCVDSNPQTDTPKSRSTSLAEWIHQDNSELKSQKAADSQETTSKDNRQILIDVCDDQTAADSTEHAHEAELGSEVDSSKEDPELVDLADDLIVIRSISLGGQ